MSRGWVVLINTRAGTVAVSEDRVAAALRRHGVEHTIEVPRGVEALREAACDAVRRGHALAVVGGDGTLSTTLDALAHGGLLDDATVGVLPAGTGCDLIRTFGIPQNLEDAARHLTTPATYRIDLGVLEGEWGVRHFVNVANAGLAAAVVEAAARLPRRLGTARYAAAIGIAAPRFRRCEVEIVTERRTHRSAALLFIAANGQFFAGGWNVAPKALLVDGKLDTQLVDVPKRAIPRLVPRLAKGLHLSHPGVRRRSIEAFRFVPDDPWPVEVDGDPIGHGAFEASMIPAAVDLKI